MPWETEAPLTFYLMYIHKWALTSKEYGISVEDLIKKVATDCGLELDCPCDTCGPGAGPTIVSVQGGPSGPSFELMQFAIEQLQAQVTQLTARLAQLENGN